MRGDDARMAIENGAAGVIVSNHGGRQLDHAPATIEALPEVVKAAAGRVPVFIDGGIRCGADVFKAVALGADQVFIGRPTIYGLTVAVSVEQTESIQLSAYRVMLVSSMSSAFYVPSLISPCVSQVAITRRW